MTATSDLPTNVLRYGREEPLPETRALRAGPLSVLFEQGDLRYVRLGDREILRRVYVAVRDHNWDTVQPKLSELVIEDNGDSFHIRFTAEHVLDDVDFAWQGSISGDAQGTIVYRMDGAARSTFRRNRIGICLLHPPREVAGARYRVEKDDGSTEEGTLPTQIAPHQPTMDMRAIAHEVLPDLWAEVRFEGDVFEMEDQRNWTDASFKTYSTPLRIPYPVEVAQGTRIAQTLTLSLQGQVPSQPAEAETATVTVGAAASGPLPRIGLGMASHGQPLSMRELLRLQALKLGHLRVDLEMGQADWTDRLRQAGDAAHTLSIPLEIAVLLGGGDEAKQLGALRKALDARAVPVVRWLVLHTDEHGKQSTSARWLQLAREHLGDYAPGAKLGAGPNSNFTELNRERPPTDAADLVFYPINPQVHAIDDASVMETLEAQGWTVHSAQAFSGGLPLAISPVTLKQRFNPVATGPQPQAPAGELPSQVDPRQSSLFGAAWTLGSIKYLAESGADSVTYFETSGWRGVMETASGSSLPNRFRSLPGAVFPLYHVLADVGEMASGQVVPTRSSATLQVEGLALRADGHTRVLLANVSPQPRHVRVVGLPERVQVRRLDETNAAQAMQAPEEFRRQAPEELQTSQGQLELELLPYAVVRID